MSIDQAIPVPCKGCKRRTVNPNCHDACKDYKRYKKQCEEVAKRYRLDRLTDEPPRRKKR